VEQRPQALEARRRWLLEERREPREVGERGRGYGASGIARGQEIGERAAEAREPVRRQRREARRAGTPPAPGRNLLRVRRLRGGSESEA